MLSNAIMPYLTYDDPKGAIEWLGKAFGAERIDVGDEGEDDIQHAELKIGNGIVLLTATDGGGALPMRSPQQTSFSSQGVFVRIEKADIDAHYERAVAAGAEVLYPLQDMGYYDSREYTCSDPEGHLWSFGTYNPGK